MRDEPKECLRRRLHKYVMGSFTEDMDYVADWLVHQGLEKLVDVFKGNSVFSILVYLFIADRKAINAVNTTIAQ